MSNTTQNEPYVNYRNKGCQYITGSGDMIMKHGKKFKFAHQRVHKMWNQLFSNLMRKNFTTVALLILPLLLTGCLGDRGQQIDIIERAIFGGSSGLSKKDLESVELGEKAIVLSRCTAFTPPVGLVIKNHSPVACQTGWRPENATESEPVTVELSSSKTQPISINVVTPGKYHLEYFIAHNDDFWNTYASTIHKADKLKGIATFSAGGGEVLYIGDIELDLKRHGGKELLIYNSEFSPTKSEIVAKAISIHNNVEFAQAVLSKRYPKLLYKLRTHLMQR